MSMIIPIPENVYNELMTGELPEAVSDVFCKKAVEIIDVADKYARYAIENIEEDFFDMIEEEIEDEYEADIDLLDAAETRIYHILRFCYIAKVSPMIETIIGLLHESEENCLFSDLLFYDNTDDTELAANKIVFIALELLKDVKEAMEIDLD